MRHLVYLFALISSAVLANNSASDADIREQIVKDSIANYKGICPCPYSIHPDGTQCGYRSAFHKNSSTKPICYEINVTLKMVDEYRAKEVSK